MKATVVPSSTWIGHAPCAERIAAPLRGFLDFLTRNNILGKCIRGSKIVVQIANEQKISTSKSCSPTNDSTSQKTFTGLKLTFLSHLKCLEFIFGLLAMKVLNMSIQPSNDLVLIGDMTFSCESQPRRVSYLLVDSYKMQKIVA